MWEDYKQKVSDVSYPVYRRVFESMKIGFGRPSQDDCDVCARHTAHQASPGEGHNAETCTDCKESRKHRVRYVKARKAYQDDANLDNRNHSLFTADLQKVILLPKMTTKEHLFVSRLVVFNETFASMNEEVDFAVLWHEEIAGRLASAFIKRINLSGKETVTFWVYNCSGQNKNWTLFSGLVWHTNQEWGPQKVTIRYLERGHTFMRADSVHGCIGSKMKKCQKIHTFDDFVELCEKASKKIKAVVMQ